MASSKTKTDLLTRRELHLVMGLSGCDKKTARRVLEKGLALKGNTELAKSLRALLAHVRAHPDTFTWPLTERY